MDNQTRIQYLKIILLIIGIIALGILAFNQFFSWTYHAQLLYKPCDLCIKLNPNYTRCQVEIMNNNNPSLSKVNFSNIKIIS